MLQVGDWATVAGLERGRDCIAQYEPAVEEECGQLLDRVGEGGFQQLDIQQVPHCTVLYCATPRCRPRSAGKTATCVPSRRSAA